MQSGAVEAINGTTLKIKHLNDVPRKKIPPIFRKMAFNSIKLAM
jgi:hypothetical protein